MASRMTPARIESELAGDEIVCGDVGGCLGPWRRRRGKKMRKERERRTYEPFHSYGFGDLPPGKDYPFPIAFGQTAPELCGMLEKENYVFVFDWDKEVAVDEGDFASMQVTYDLFPNTKPDDQDAAKMLIEIYENLRKAPTEKTEPTG